MIFVTVGTTPFSFDRLLIELDNITATQKHERFVAQIGYSRYEPRNMEWFRFARHKEMEILAQKSRLVVTHGGAGSILTVLTLNKPVIAVPRMKRFGEHIDDHQLDLVKSLEKEKMLIGIYQIRDLQKGISNNIRQKQIKSTKQGLIEEIGSFLGKIERDAE